MSNIGKRCIWPPIPRLPAPQARVYIGGSQYDRRPHSSLADMTPTDYANESMKDQDLNRANPN